MIDHKMKEYTILLAWLSPLVILKFHKVLLFVYLFAKGHFINQKLISLFDCMIQSYMIVRYNLYLSRFLIGQYFESGILCISAGQSGNGEEGVGRRSSRRQSEKKNQKNLLLVYKTPLLQNEQYWKSLNTPWWLSQTKYFYAI